MPHGFAHLSIVISPTYLTPGPPPERSKQPRSLTLSEGRSGGPPSPVVRKRDDESSFTLTHNMDDYCAIHDLRSDVWGSGSVGPGCLSPERSPELRPVNHGANTVDQHVPECMRRGKHEVQRT